MLSSRPPLTDNVKYIDSGLRFSFPQQVQPVPLDVTLFIITMFSYFYLLSYDWCLLLVGGQ